MFVPVSNNAQGGYEIQKSLRLRSSASAYLSKSYTAGSSTADTDQKRKTFNFHVKRGALGTTQTLLSNFYNGDNYWTIQFIAAGGIQIFATNGAVVNVNKLTTALYRDPGAHYEIQVSIDTTDASAEDRVRLYVNGVRVTSFSVNTTPSQNTGQFFLCPAGGTWNANIGRLASPGQYSDVYLSEFVVVDGQALDPSYFGQTDAATGAWVPTKYTGTYGTNGFYLDFKDGTSLTTLGQDKSGNGNNWTLNNVSLTSGATYDWMDDTPTNNFCTMSPLDAASSFTISDGNLRVLTTNGTIASGRATFGLSSGRWYWEWNCASSHSVEMIGICGPDASLGAHIGNASSGYGYFANTGQKYNGGVNTAYGATYTNGDIIGVEFDADAGTIDFYKNGVSQGTAFSAIPAGTYFPALSDASSSLATTGSFNFGQRPFARTLSAGYKTLCTKNLPVPTIKNGRKYMDASTRVGTGAAFSTTDTGFSPNLVWIKSRSGTTAHQLLDTERGAGNKLYSNLTNAEEFDATSLTSFDANGFSGGANAGINANGGSYVDWLWKESAISGFDIVTYTGTGVARTVAHGLGVAPKMIIIKRRNGSGDNWQVYHDSIPSTQAVFLESTAAANTSSGYWNNTPPTSSEFTVGTSLNSNANGGDYIAYLWAEVPGFSKFGSYTGNGSANGPFVWCGFRPRWLLVKCSSSAATNWELHDTEREPYNVGNLPLFANLSNAESAADRLDTTCNGFKVRSTTADLNTNGASYIYAAFAELPFKYANAR